MWLRRLKRDAGEWCALELSVGLQATWLGCSACVVFGAELGSIALLLGVVFNGVVPVVALAETSGCRAESSTSRLCLVYVPLYVGVLDD